MNIDFENYSVEEERAKEIRGLVKNIKEQNWVEALKYLVEELGQVEVESGKQTGLDLLADHKVKVYRPNIENFDASAEIVLSGSELKLLLSGSSILEVNFLPKNDDYIVFYLDASKWELMQKLVSALQNQVTAAKQVKAERQAAFKAKFKAKELVAN